MENSTPHASQPEKNESTQSATEVKSPTSEETTEEESSLSDLSRKWIVYRLFTLLFWCWIILRISGKTIPYSIPVDRDYLVIPYLGSLAWFILARKWWRALFHPLYFICFPFLVLLKALWWVFILLRHIFKAPVRAFQVAKSGAAIVLTSLVVTVAWAVTFLSYKPNSRAIAALLAHISTYLLFLQSFRWASNPYKPIIIAVDFLSKKGKSAFEDAYIKPGMTSKGTKRDKAIEACDWCLKTLDKLSGVGAPIREGLTAFTHGSVVPMFIYWFVILYIVLCTSFSLSLYEIEKAWGAILTGHSDGTRFGYFYFSFLSQATAVPDGVKPLSGWGQAWLIWIVGTAVLLLTILIALFTTSVGVHGESTLSEVRNFSETAKRDVIIWRKQLTQPVIDIEAIDVEAKVTDITPSTEDQSDHVQRQD